MTRPDSGKENSVEFSIVIPAYNAEAFLEKCIDRLMLQDIESEKLEAIIVDDCSSDSTYDIAARLANDHKNVRVARTDKNSGPGTARNVGVHNATGTWILFLDSDDYLHENALSQLHEFLSASGSDTMDAVGFNWEFDQSGAGAGHYHTPGRRDHVYLEAGTDTLIKEYLSLHMDGSVIYTAVRKQLLDDNNIEFASGYHEDVDYIFKIYWHARSVGYLDRVLYVKEERSDSIVNTVSVHHIVGFMRAWKEIGDFVAANDAGRWRELLQYYTLGLYGAIATRAREIYRRSGSIEQAAEIYSALYKCWTDYFVSSGDFAVPPAKKTKYVMIAEHFIAIMQDGRLSDKIKAETINGYIADIAPKSWSCVDLHHSVFLAPDQIRTCCKRFFVGGEMRGDVCLIELPESGFSAVSSEGILEAKQKLYAKINSGADSDCDGCPFLEFKEWDSLANLDIQYLSLEYHSICNLRCTYCSELFYSGKKPRYDINSLMESLLGANALENCKNLVWGGGEPILDGNFNALIERIVEKLPSAHKRVLTNAVIYSDAIERFLREDKIFITSSVDAGTEETYRRLRGRPKFKEALCNLRRYASANASKVTVKYIFTEGNSTIEEVRAFISLVREYELTGCNFQISSDFKKENISLDDVVLMIAMYGLLNEAQSRVVFFDDLLRIRLDEANASSEVLIRSRLAEMGLAHALADRTSYRSVAIWGAGWQAKYLIEKTSFFKHVNVEYFVDSTVSKIGGKYLGHDIFAPAVLLDTDIPVVIAAVQGFPLIYDAFLNLGINESRLIKKLIL